MPADSVAVLRAMRSVFDAIPNPCAERDALDAAIAALSAQGAGCRLHPRYKAIHPPRSTKPDCTCQQVYDAKHPAPGGVGDAVTEEMCDAFAARYHGPNCTYSPSELKASLEAALAARTGKGDANGR